MKKAAVLLSTVLISFLLFRNSFNAFFFQDDWFTLRISNADNWAQFSGFFIPRNDVIYYRPLGMQIPFFLLQTFFGINPVPFHVVVFIVHIVNIWLVYKLVSMLTRKENISLLSSYLYGISSIHFTPFYWLSTFPFIFGPLFFFSSFILFLKYLEKHKLSFYLSSLAFLIAGLLVNEMSVTLPFILIIYALIFEKKTILKASALFILPVLILLFLRFYLFQPPMTGSYHLLVGPNIITNLKTYIFWSFNWSEMITEQMIRPFLFNDLIMKDYGLYAYILDGTLLGILISGVVSLYGLIKSGRMKQTAKCMIFGCTWFIIGLAPVILFVGHKFSYYLPISLVGFLLTITPLFISDKIKKSRLLLQLILFCLLISWTVSTVITVDFNSKNHWVSNRAKISKQLTEKVRADYKTLLSTVNTINIPYSSENQLALNNQDGLKVFLNNEKIVTQYIK